MPESKPSSIGVMFAKDWQPTLKDLQKQLNYLFDDVYNYIDGIQGYGGRVFTPENIDPSAIGSHSHTSASTGGDYPWADIIAADVSWLQAVRATVQASNVWDKSTFVPVSLLGADPDAPALGAVLYVKDNAGTKELKARFADGTIKVITNDL